ncbi:MAG: tetratricopeptide repeat protein, partial [Anaerolineae bacterium]|nr:tetratricopeptide repeat protein [Anaerolineae bacterium]
MTQSDDPSPRSGGITVGDQTAQGNVTTHLENVAGRDQISHSLVVQPGGVVNITNLPPTEKPGFSPLELPLEQIPPAASLPPGSRMPFTLNPHFVGREQEMRQVAYRLQTGDTAAIGQMAAITGLGGVGKSQLAIAFAHHYGHLFAGGVFWVNMSDEANVPAELAQCGYAMQLGEGYDRLTLEEQVRRVQRSWQERIPRLLLFDNCEEEGLLAQWRPKTGGCRVLVTSRRAAWDVSLGVALLPLDTLTPPQSRALLQKLAPHLNDGEAEAIAGELGHLPLALHLAGSYLHSYRHAPFARPATYLAELQQERLAHPSLQGEGVSHSPTAHERHVGRTFALSLERLNPDDGIDQVARALLACAAHFAPGVPIPRSLLLMAAGISSDHRADQLRGEQGMARLGGLGLLTVDTETDWPVIHRLVAAFVQAEKLAEDAQAQVEKAVINEAYRLNMAGYPRALLPWQGQLWYVTEQALPREDSLAAALANNLGFHLQDLGEYAAARPLYERSLSIREQALGPNHPDVALSLNNLALLLCNQGEYAAARPLYEQALSIREQALGPAHPDVAQSLNNLAALLYNQGEYAAARPLYERALSIREQALGPAHPDVAQSLNNLALLLQNQGEYAAA